MKTSTLLKAALVAEFNPPPTKWNYRLQRHCTSLLTLLALLFGHLAVGQVFYISPLGNDGNSGEGEGPTEAWATIDRVNTELLSGGNKTFLFERGGVYRGSIEMPVFTNDVHFGEYGSGLRPIIKNSRTISDGAWSLHAGSIYKVSLSVPSGAVVKQVYAQNTRQTLAREPNTGWLRTDAVDENTNTLEDANLTQSGGYWVDAEVVLRTTNWSYRRYAVVGSDPGELVLDAGFESETDDVPGWGYFLCGKLDLLDAPGEWFFDNTTGDLYYWPATGPPSGVEYAILDPTSENNRGISFNSSNTGSVTGISFQHQTDAGISLSVCSSITVEDCVFQDLFNGIAGDAGAGGHSISDCLFERTYGNAFRLSSGNSVVEDNTFQDIALWPGEGENDWGYYGIMAGPGDIVRRNKLDNVGYSGIGILGLNAIIEHNSVSNWLAILNDGAAITFDLCDGLTVRDNIVYGVRQGLADRLESVPPGYDHNEDISYGIYFGNRPILNTIVERNVVSGCAAGIHVDHTTTTEGLVVQDNVLFDNGIQLSLSDHSNCMSGTGTNPCDVAVLGVVGPTTEPGMTVSTKATSCIA